MTFRLVVHENFWTAYVAYRLTYVTVARAYAAYERAMAKRSLEQIWTPVARDYERKTPRSLKRTLRALRTNGASHRKDDFAKKLYVAPSQLAKFEGRMPGSREEREFQLSMDHLIRYQEAVHIPTGIIVLISQILAAARDGQEVQLEVIYHMGMEVLARLADEDGRKLAIRNVRMDTPENDEPGYQHWDNFLLGVIGSLWDSIPNEKKGAFKDLARQTVLQTERDDNRENSTQRARRRRRRKAAKKASSRHGKDAVPKSIGRKKKRKTSR